MRELSGTCRIAYMGTSGIEKRLVAPFGCTFLCVECPKLIRSLTPKNLTLPFRLRAAQHQALELLRRDPPDLVFAKGGYASYPAVWAAAKLNIPVLTHESDLTPGLCTRLVAGKCVRVLTSFPETAEKFRNGMCVGSPIRREIFGKDRRAARKKYGFSEEKPVLLVLGGGSGSRALNDAVNACLDELRARFFILQLCGKGNAAGPCADGCVRLEFERDMGSAYACADIVLSRAGSNAVFEILAMKKPALLVPLSRCSRGDQIKNAQYFEKKGLCAVLGEQDLQTLPAALLRLYGNATIRQALDAYHVENGVDGILKEVRTVLGGA